MAKRSKKALEISGSAPENLRQQAADLAENVLWMAVKLEETRLAIGDEGVSVPYDNGGGQSGMRRNPAFDGYNALMSSYTKALKQLCEMTGKHIEEESLDESLDSIISAAKPTRKRKAD